MQLGVFAAWALVGAAAGWLSLAAANRLIEWSAAITPLAEPPQPLPLTRWGPVAALAGAALSAALTVTHGATVPIVIAAFELFVLQIVFYIDLRAHLILDVVVAPSALVVLAVAVAEQRWMWAVAGALLGLLVYALLYGVGWLLTRQEALGLGDVKLAALLGLMVGLGDIMRAILVAAFVGGVASLVLVLSRQRATSAYIPYGVFMAIGAAVFIVRP